MKKLLLATLLALAPVAAQAGIYYDLRSHTSSAALRIGLSGVNGEHAVFISSGSAVVQSTTSVSGHKILDVRNQANSTILSVAQDGTLSMVAGVIDTAKIGGGAVDTSKILQAAVTNVKIADGAVDTGKLSGGAVDTGKILQAAVTNVKIANGAVDTAKIANGSVDTTKLSHWDLGASQALRRNSGNTAWEAFTPSNGFVAVGSYTVIADGSTTQNFYNVSYATVTATWSTSYPVRCEWNLVAKNSAVNYCGVVIHKNGSWPTNFSSDRGMKGCVDPVGGTVCELTGAHIFPASGIGSSDKFAVSILASGATTCTWPGGGGSATVASAPADANWFKCQEVQP